MPRPPLPPPRSALVVAVALLVSSPGPLRAPSAADGLQESSADRARAAAPWEALDPVLGIPGPDGSLQPLAGAPVAPGQVVAVGVEVRDGERPVAAARVLGDRGRTLATARPRELVKKEGPVHVGRVRVRAPEEPGQYRVQVNVTDPPVSRYRIFRLPLGVDPARPLRDVAPVPAELVAADTAPFPTLRRVVAAEAARVGATEAWRIAAGVDVDLPAFVDRLGRVAGLYLDDALRFVADETIVVETAPGASGREGADDEREAPQDDLLRERHELEYIYGYREGAGGRGEADSRVVFEDNPLAIGAPAGPAPSDFTDYRRRQGDEADLDPGEVVAELHLPGFLSRAYSWAFLFLGDALEAYRFAAVGRGRALGTDCVVVGFAPAAAQPSPWVGVAWVDPELAQIVRVLAWRLDEFREAAALARVTPGEMPERRVFTFTRTLTEMGVLENAMRFPSRVETVRAAHVVQDERARADTLERHLVFRTEQLYDEYRFLSVRTEEEIRTLISDEEGR